MSEPDRRAIDEAIAAFTAAYNPGDLAALLSYYDDDLLNVRQGADIESKGETEQRVSDVFARFETRVDVDNVETVVDGDLAFTRGTFTVTLAPRDDGDTLVIGRRYLEIWRRRDGRWRVVRTMDNAAGAPSPRAT